MSERTSAGRLGSIEACRGIAAAAVVLYHAARHLNKIYGLPSLTAVFQFGHAGVDLFFVISGFIILYVHYRDINSPARLRHYVGRRFTRVMPTYWVALALTVLLAAGGHAGLPSLSDLIWSVSLAPSDHQLLLGIAWTLRYEIIFYALFCILIVNRIAGLVTMSVWLAAIIFVASWPRRSALARSVRLLAYLTSNSFSVWPRPMRCATAVFGHRKSGWRQVPYCSQQRRSRKGQAYWMAMLTTRASPMGYHLR